MSKDVILLLWFWQFLTYKYTQLCIYSCVTIRDSQEAPLDSSLLLIKQLQWEGLCQFFYSLKAGFPFQAESKWSLRSKEVMSKSVTIASQILLEFELRCIGFLIHVSWSAKSTLLWKQSDHGLSLFLSKWKRAFGKIMYFLFNMSLNELNFPLRLRNVISENAERREFSPFIH